ncbi:hypothetical protein HPO96_04560 [Kribbella sandramycini]|uniref:Uncharacterized protein n=1 Tax=Kribbella sandramycini TaxID=60450 RepID=A0A7Y4NX51_9ACTN|nr:hypothetical protein [Kribbella sandramycini]MBB6567893.1 hypothetical protein [Kribbella sandramycini]NOL39512.1 hypothetical protein [Kribbella sandramycini]
MAIAGGTPAKGRSGPATPAVVGVSRSMRARDVSQPREPGRRRGVIPPETAGPKKGQETGGSSPVDS